MSDTFNQLQTLDEYVRAITIAESPSYVLKVLRDGCRLAAPRAAVFLVRRGRLQGWSSIGFPPEVARAQKGWSVDDALGKIEQFRPPGDSPLLARSSPDRDPEFGQPVPAESVCGLLELQETPIALIVAERSAGEFPWYPQALALLLSVARLRLELDLFRRKATHAAPAEPSEPVPARTVEPMPAKPPAELTEVALANETGSEDPPELAAARRFARLVATDIRLYNEEAVMLGRQNGDLAQRLDEPLGRGRETFLDRHGDLGPEGLDLLHAAYVQVLAAGDSRLIPVSTVKR